MDHLICSETTCPAVVTNITLPSSSLKKKHNAIPYHQVREAITAGILGFVAACEGRSQRGRRSHQTGEYNYTQEPYSPLTVRKAILHKSRGVSAQGPNQRPQARE